MEIDIMDPLPKNRTEIPGRSIITAAQDTFNLLGLAPILMKTGSSRPLGTT